MNNWLAELRKHKHLSHEEIADLSGIERSYYTKIEGAKRTPSIKVAKRLGDILGFHWTIFFDNSVTERHKEGP